MLLPPDQVVPGSKQRALVDLLLGLKDAGHKALAVDSVLGWTRVLAAPMRVLAAPSRMLTLPTRVLTAPTRAIGEVVPCVRRLPIVGGLFE